MFENYDTRVEFVEQSARDTVAFTLIQQIDCVRKCYVGPVVNTVSRIQQLYLKV